MNDIIAETELRMEHAIETLEKRLLNIRAGRANPSILDGVMANYYGVETPLKQLATISIPEARQLMIKPFDKSSLQAIEKGIYEANIGLTPNNNGETIILNIPALTEEKRKALVKEVYGMAENAKVAIRNIRRDMNTSLKKQEKEIPEDQFRKLNEDIQKQTDEFIKKIDEVTKVKEKELLTV